MSTIIGTKNVTIEERTWKIEIMCESGDDPIVRADRETVISTDDGTVLFRDRSARHTERRLSQVADQKFMLGDSAITGLQLSSYIATAVDDFRKEDIKNG